MLSTVVVPLAFDLLKFADLVEAVAPAINFIAGHKLHGTGDLIRTASFGIAYAQAQPMRITVQPHLFWPRVGMPGAQQVALITQYKTTVARTHQLLCAVRSLPALYKAATAVGVVDCAAAGTGRLVTFSVRAGHGIRPPQAARSPSRSAAEPARNFVTQRITST